MTEDSVSREPAVGFVLLGKQTILDAMGAAGKNGLLTVTALLWYADNNTGRCHPSLPTLAARAGLQLKTLRTALRKLRDAGLLTWEDRTSEGKTHLFTIGQTIHTKSTVGDLFSEKDPDFENPVGKRQRGTAKPLDGAMAKSPQELDSATTTPRTRKSMSDLYSDFCQFWGIYDRKDTSKKKAWAAWQREAKAGKMPPVEVMVDQVKRYRLHTFKGRPEDRFRQFLQHPHRWLSEQRYLSEYPDTFQGGPGSGGRLQPVYDPGEAGEKPAF